jgi:hypothetical protein
MRSRAFILALTIAAISLQPGEASSNSTTKAFQAYLNGLQMDSIIPMMSMQQVFAGGLVTSKGKTADFHPLPQGVTPPTATSGDPETFPAESSKSSLSLSIALNALFGWAIGGNLAHSKNSDVNQIDATFYTSNDLDTTLKDPKTQAYIKDLIQRQHLKVYQVRSVSTTKTIKFTTSGSLGGGVSVSGGNGTDAKATNCQSSSGNQPTGAASGNTENGATPSSSGAKQNAMQAQASTPTAGTPGGSLQLCTSGDNNLTLTTSGDMVFAAKVYEVALDPGTNSYIANAIPAHAGQGGWSDLMTQPANSMKESDVRRQGGAAAGLNPKWHSEVESHK